MLLLLLISLLIIPRTAYSQERVINDRWVEFVQEQAEQLQSSSLSDVQLEAHISDLYEDLQALTQSPISLYGATAEDLSILPFLSEKQAQGIVAYVAKYRPLLSLYELANAGAMDRQTLDYLLPFVVLEEVPAKPPSFNELFRGGRHQARAFYARTLEPRAGYADSSAQYQEEHPSRFYLGDPNAYTLQYDYQQRQYLQAGVIVGKDAGEPFMDMGNYGTDYLSAHLFLKDLGVFKSIAIGDFRASFGQGLVMNSDFYLGKSSLVTEVARPGRGLRRDYSTSEQPNLRGVGTTLSLGRFDLSLFASSAKIDARVADDTISSFKTDGLHRLPLDMAKRRMVRMNTYGANLTYIHGLLRLGVTGVYYDWGGMTLSPDDRPYRQYAYRGCGTANLGLHYAYRWRTMSLSGETAVMPSGAVATVNTLLLDPATDWSFVATYRYYDKRYYGYYANSFGESSSVNNEEGLYVGVVFKPYRGLKLSGYADLFRFPWLRYGVSMPSVGAEYLAQAEYTWGHHSLLARYCYRRKAKDAPADLGGGLAYYTTQRARLEGRFSFGDRWSLKSYLDANHYAHVKTPTWGWIVGQSLAYSTVDDCCAVQFHAAYFDTDDYYSRVYSSEGQMLNYFSSTSFYGQGLRASFVVRYRPVRWVTFSCKGAYQHYLGRSTVGSGNELINRSHRTDLQLMATFRW